MVIFTPITIPETIVETCHGASLQFLINDSTMKKSIAFLTAICICLSCFAQTLKTISWEDTTRQYLEYVPETYDASTPTPVVFIFHGLGGNMYEVLYNADFNRIAAEQGWITVTPQALPDTFTAMDTTLTMNAWHSGVSAVVDGDTIVASEGRDDTGLMMAILDSLIAHYNIDQSNVFCTGVSMGGFMSHRMAIEHGDRIKAIAPVCGTIGNEITSYTPVGHVSVMHLHGTADSIVTYDSGSFQYIVNVNVGLGVDSTIAFWRRYNQCSDTAIHTIFPDICDDGRLFEKFYYGDGTFGTKTVLIKVNGGEHEWCHGPYRDVDFTDEIYNFFASCLGNVPTVVVTATDIAATTATFSGEVTAEGSAAVTARGVCWSSTPHPTIANLHTTDSLGLGAFTSIIPDLTPNTTYYARAYATNEVGTAYSDEICFTTLCDYSALNDTIELTLCENDLPYHYVNGDIDTTFEVGTPNLSVFNFQLSNQYGCDSTFTLTLTILPCDTNSIPVYAGGLLTLYPNPTNGIVNVQCTMNNGQWEDAELRVFDVYGRLLHTVETCHGASLQTIEIDLSHYATGVYFIRLVKNGKVMAVRKVVRGR